MLVLLEYLINSLHFYFVQPLWCWWLNKTYYYSQVAQQDFFFLLHRWRELFSSLERKNCRGLLRTLVTQKRDRKQSYNIPVSSNGFKYYRKPTQDTLGQRSFLHLAGGTSLHVSQILFLASVDGKTHATYSWACLLGNKSPLLSRAHFKATMYWIQCCVILTHHPGKLSYSPILCTSAQQRGQLCASFFS